MGSAVESPDWAGGRASIRYRSLMVHPILVAVPLMLCVALASCTESNDRGATVAPVKSHPGMNPSPAPVESAPSIVFQRVAVSEECNEYFYNAGRTGSADHFYGSAAFACSGPDEWASGVYAHPNGLGLASLRNEDVRVALETVCYGYVMNEATVCVQAVAAGLFDAPAPWANH